MRNFTLRGLLIAALVTLVMPCWASTIVYRFRVVDDSNVPVAGCTIVQNTTKSFAPSTLGNAVAGLTLTPVDLGNGDYGIAYDPEGSNGEVIVNYTISKAGSTFSGANASISILLTKDSSRVLNADVAVSTVKAKSDLIATNGADSPNAVTAQGTISTNLNATVSSRSTYAGADTAGTTTLLSRIGTPANGSLAADIAALPTAAGNATAIWNAAVRQLTGSQTFNLSGNITGNLSGSVGSITGVNFPSNFSMTSIDGSGKVALQASEHTAIQNDAGVGVMATVVDGGFTMKQCQALSIAVLTGNYTITRNTGAKTITVVYYRPTDPATTTTVFATLVTNYSDTGLTIPTSRTVTFTNKP